MGICPRNLKVAFGSDGGLYPGSDNGGIIWLISQMKLEYEVFSGKFIFNYLSAISLCCLVNINSSTNHCYSRTQNDWPDLRIFYEVYVIGEGISYKS